MSLFDRLDSAPSQAGARATDPDTAHGAAEALSGVKLRRQQALVLAAIGELARRGQPDATAAEVVIRLAYGDVQRGLGYTGDPPDQGTVASRCAELHRGGLLTDGGERRPGRRNRPLIAWRLTTKALEVLR